jgi:hypothetical protein
VGADNRNVLIIEVLGVPDLELGPRLLLPARGLVRIRPKRGKIFIKTGHEKPNKVRVGRVGMNKIQVVKSTIIFGIDEPVLTLH